MTAIGEMPVSRVIDYERSILVLPFYFQSDVLKKLGLKHDIKVPAGFMMDWESVPIIKGTSKIAGLIHDFLCRIDSDPVVTKKIAADVYLEFLKFRKTSWWRRWGKYLAVRGAPGYFHKLSVLTPNK